MALLVHLPLTGDLHNQGLANIEVTNNGATVDNNGKIGKCYSFDGTSKYISLTNPFTNASEISCSIWVKPLTNTSTNEQIMNIGTSSGWSNIRFGILQQSNNQFVFHVSDGTNTINYNCNKHNKSYISYCLGCEKDLCITIKSCISALSIICDYFF